TQRASSLISGPGLACSTACATTPCPLAARVTKTTTNFAARKLGRHRYPTSGQRSTNMGHLHHMGLNGEQSLGWLGGPAQSGVPTACGHRRRKYPLRIWAASHSYD